MYEADERISARGVGNNERFEHAETVRASEMVDAWRKDKAQIGVAGGIENAGGDGGDGSR